MQKHGVCFARGRIESLLILLNEYAVNKENCLKNQTSSTTLSNENCYQMKEHGNDTNFGPFMSRNRLIFSRLQRLCLTATECCQGRQNRLLSTVKELSALRDVRSYGTFLFWTTLSKTTEFSIEAIIWI